MFLLQLVTSPHHPHLCRYSETVRVLIPKMFWPRYSLQVRLTLSKHPIKYNDNYLVVDYITQILLSVEFQFPLLASYSSGSRVWATSLWQHDHLWKPQHMWALRYRVLPQCLPLLVSTVSPAAVSPSPANPAPPPPVAALYLDLLPLLGQVGPHGVKLPSPYAGNCLKFVCYLLFL